MITFSAGAWRFNFRVGAVVIRDGHILLMKIDTGDFWFVPGGRIETGESARRALERELIEELGVAGRVGRLLWTNENFFRMKKTLFHELALYFEAALPRNAHRDLSARIAGTEGDGTRYECAWHPLGSLNQIRLQPSFLTRGLTRLPDAPQHVVHVDVSAAPYVT